MTLSEDMISNIIVSEYNSTNTIILSCIAAIAIIAGLIYVLLPKVDSFHFE